MNRFRLLPLLLLGWLSLCAGAAPSRKPTNSAAERLARVENELTSVEQKGEAPMKVTLTEWMKLLRISGASVAVFDNFRIVEAKGYGVTEAGSTQPVTTRTLFQAGSISKPVAAAAAMSFVQRCLLSLDEDVNQKLASWKVPNNEFTAQEKVTLRRLLSHSARLTVHGFPGYALDAPVPSVVQVLNGEKPATPQRSAWTCFPERACGTRAGERRSCNNC